MRVGSWNVGSMSGRDTEVCEELRKRRMDVCCLQEVRWRGQGARFIGVKGGGYNLCWSGNSYCFRITNTVQTCYLCIPRHIF